MPVFENFAEVAPQGTEWQLLGIESNHVAFRQMFEGLGGEQEWLWESNAPRTLPRKQWSWESNARVYAERLPSRYMDPSNNWESNVPMQWMLVGVAVHGDGYLYLYWQAQENFSEEST